MTTYQDSFTPRPQHETPREQILNSNQSLGEDGRTSRNLTVITDAQSIRTNNILHALQDTTNQLRALLAQTN